MTMTLKYTGIVPICPKCKIGTKRQRGMTLRLSKEKRGTFDKYGDTVFEDIRRETTQWTCLKCGNVYATMEIFDD